MANKRAQRKQKKAQRRKKRVAKDKRQQPQQSSPAERMAKNIQEHLDQDRVEFIQNPPGEVKMSDVLDDFVSPYEHTATTEEAYKELLAIGTLAWNIALIDKGERTEQIEETVTNIVDDPQDQQDIREILTELIERKDHYFPDIRRRIYDFEITQTSTGYHLQVASTLSLKP